MTACLSTQLETCALCQGACDNHNPRRNFCFKWHIFDRKNKQRVEGLQGWSKKINKFCVSFSYLWCCSLVKNGRDQWILASFFPSPPPGCCLVLGSQLFSSFVWRSVSGCWNKYTAWTKPPHPQNTNQHKSHPATLLSIRHECLRTKNVSLFPSSLSSFFYSTSQREPGSEINKRPRSFAWTRGRR